MTHDTPSDDAPNTTDVDYLHIALKKFTTQFEDYFGIETPDRDGVDPALHTARRLHTVGDALAATFEQLDRRENELRRAQEALETEQTALRLRLPERTDTEPCDLSFDEKVCMVREQAYRRAVGMNGRVALDIKDIQWGMFDGEISREPCYRLMRRAAGLGDDGRPYEEVPGFRVLDDPMRLAVNAEDVDPKASIHGFGPTTKGSTK